MFIILERNYYFNINYIYKNYKDYFLYIFIEFDSVSYKSLSYPF